MKRWFSVMVLVTVLVAGCSGGTSSDPASVLEAWAQAVADKDAAKAATFMQTPPDDWTFQVSKVHRYPVTSFKVVKPLAPAPDGNGQVATVIWDRTSDDPVLRYACIKTVRMVDNKIVVKRDTVGICDAQGEQ